RGAPARHETARRETKSAAHLVQPPAYCILNASGRILQFSNVVENPLDRVLDLAKNLFKRIQRPLGYIFPSPLDRRTDLFERWVNYVVLQEPDRRVQDIFVPADPCLKKRLDDIVPRVGDNLSDAPEHRPNNLVPQPTEHRAKNISDKDRKSGV